MAALNGTIGPVTLVFLKKNIALLCGRVTASRGSVSPVIQSTPSHPFPPATWSVYLQAVRTNNDLEGWHNALNRRAKGRSQLPLYILIQLLHKEASLVSLQIRLVSERRLRRHQQTTYRNMQKKLFSLWNDYEDGRKNSKQLLEACSYLVQTL